MDWIREEMCTPVLGEYDVIVAGGGVAGVAAAVAAGRRGARVLLLEKSVVLGGLATQGLISWYEPLCRGTGEKLMTGMPDELMNLAMRYGFNTLPEEWKGGVDRADTKRRCATHFSHSLFAMALDQWVLEAGVELLLDTMVVAVSVKGMAIDGVVVENKSGRGCYRAKMFIDATGDADLVKLSGTPVEDGVSYLTYVGYCADPSTAQKAAETGDMFHVRKWIMAGANLFGGGHPRDVKLFQGIDAQEVTRFVLQGRKLLFDRLDDSDTKARDITALPGMAQYRKTRRMMGVQTLTADAQGQRCERSIGVAIDFNRVGDVYEMPYEILYAREVSNLFAAGRCVSSTGWAWDVTRVIPIAVATGEAAGTAAALCVQSGSDCAGLEIGMLQRALREQSVRLHIDEND